MKGAPARNHVNLADIVAVQFHAVELYAVGRYAVVHRLFYRARLFENFFEHKVRKAVFFGGVRA